MTRRRALLPAMVCALLAVAVPAASAKTQFHPRVRGALGLIPPVNSQGRFGADDIASGALTPVTYHGGAVMAGGVTVHTIFWAPSGFAFQGSPGAGIPTYTGMVEKFFTDVSAANGADTNIFSVLPQFAQGSTAGTPSAPGAYDINYNSANPDDAVIDTDPYPSSGQCASPNNATGACLTDAQVQAEVDHVVQNTSGTPRGLHNLWYVFLPPDVDECILPGVCGTNAFGGYHSVSDVGHGTTIYAVTIDPIIEAGSIAQGGDPQGNPDAEVTADIAGHETVEAMTDPQGVGYMDPNGFEVADKCEFGPQHGTPLGFAGPDNSPYNQVINGDKWLLQEMWSNNNDGCVQSTGSTSNPLPLPQVNLTQFSGAVTGDIGGTSPVAGVGVLVKLLRMGADGTADIVASASGATNASGDWSVNLPHPAGDDRDEIDVDYTDAAGHPGSAPSPTHQVILTGNGGNPITESGWTGWNAMDNGTAVSNASSVLQIAPCFQTGVLSATVGGSALTPPNGDDGLVDFCSTQTDVSSVPLSSAVSGSQAVTVSSNDNRAFQDPNLTGQPNTVGGLVKLTVPTGEPDSVSLFASPLIFQPGGFPTCAADLEAKGVSCTGLVPGNTYTVTDGSSHPSTTADDNGTVSVALPVKGGDVVTLTNSSHLALTTLHVANLRVDINGEQTVLAGGSCQADNYYGGPLSSIPTSGAAGAPSDLVGGAALTGEICPSNGDASGLPSSPIVQTDEHSQGTTQTEVPDVEDTSPMQGETVYGKFTALAESGLPGPDNSVTPDTTSSVGLLIRHSSGGSPVFHSSNVATANGVTVSGLAPGTYTAKWTLKDANGDTRTVMTRFIEQSALRGPPGPRGPRGPAGPKPKVSCKTVKHHKIKCTVTFSKSKKGKLQVRLSRGARVAAMGHSKLNGRKATVTLRQVRRLTSGRWTITLVVTPPHQRSTTTTMRLRMA